MDMPSTLRPISFNEKDWPLKASLKLKKDIFPDSRPCGSNVVTGMADNIAAIDFGTTHCSLAYSTASGGIGFLALNESFKRVPTAILLYKEGEVPLGKGVRVRVQSFGRVAQAQYGRIRGSERCKYIYFERMKMRLQHDLSVDRSMRIADHNSFEWYLIEVVALILQYLKDEFNKKLQKCEPGFDGNRLRATDFDWVITVPAIWQARGKGMMREAGNLAGLYNEKNAITYLSYASQGVQQSDENVSVRLSLIPEPEAAAIYCRRMKSDELAAACQMKLAKVELEVDQYIVVDAGGGTIDVTVQSQNKENGKIEVIHAPVGNDYGGVTVNHEFAKFIQKILGERPTSFSSVLDLESAFPRLLSGDHMEVLKPLLNELLFKDFDVEKERFGSDVDHHTALMEDREISVKIPDKIVRKCKLETITKNVQKLNDSMVEMEDDVLYIKYPRVADFFRPSLTGIWDCVKKVLLSLMLESDSIKTLFLVGGFGGSKYVYSHIENMILSEYPNSNFVLAVPNDHNLAVVHGAVLHKKFKPLIQSRLLNRTYGLGLSVPFHPSIHSEDHIRYNEDGEKVCTGCFLTLVQSGDPICVDRVSVCDILPDIESRVISIPFYCSEETSLKYLYDLTTPGVKVPLAHKVGELKFILPEDDILHQDQRTFTVILDFSSTEIYATVKYCNTGEDIHTKLDFLC